MAPDSKARLDQLGRHLAPVHDPSRMDGQVVLITGGAQGIGRATAELAASKGAKIVIGDLDESKARLAVDELRQQGYEATHLSGDLLDVSMPPKLVKHALETFGKINVLVNCAGFLLDAPIHKMTEEQFDVVLKMHNYVPYRMIKALSTHWMDKANREMTKVIVNISSTSGAHGAQGQVNYSTAKAGIMGLTRAMAREWSRLNVRCNAAIFGWIDTRMTRPPDETETFTTGGQKITAGIPRTYKKWVDTSDILVQERPGTAQEAASMLHFLASPMSSYMTGACVECTGGSGRRFFVTPSRSYTELNFPKLPG